MVRMQYNKDCTKKTLALKGKRHKKKPLLLKGKYYKENQGACKRKV